MKVLIVFAHPEAASFSAALKDTAVATLTELRHDVIVSDLYRSGFYPVGGTKDFAHKTEFPFNYQEEQRRAYREDTYAVDIKAEQQKVIECDILMLNFPMWWYGPPAILKGWIERVLSAGFAYDRDRRYESGGLCGRLGLLTVTTGSPAERYADEEPNPFATMQQLLLPLEIGLFHYVGMKVLKPFVAYSANRVDDVRRREFLGEYRAHLRDHINPA